jgi:tRNA(Arg) A34 adenosine deaminase TadA
MCKVGVLHSRRDFFLNVGASAIAIAAFRKIGTAHAVAKEAAAVLEEPPPMTRDEMIAHLRTANKVARETAAHGHHPFGAVLVGPDGMVMMRQGNLDTVRHAETELARRAFAAYGPAFLRGCTLVTTFEPCAMCAGTIYWANIGRVVYGVEETALLALTGDSAENPTMHLAARTVLGSGQKKIEVYGPFPELEAELVEPHRDFWK